MNCKICFEKYDKEKRKPLIAISCGHSLCSICLLELKKQDSTFCSICREPIQNEKINYDLMDILDLDLIVDPNAKLRKEIKSYFEDVDQLEDQLKLACNEKLEHSQLKVNCLKEEIEASANEFINEIQRKKIKLLNEVDDLHVDLSKHIKVLSEKTNFNIERKDVNKMREIELDYMNIKLPEFKFEIQSKLEAISGIELVYEFMSNRDLFLGANSKLTPQNQLDINTTSSSARSSLSLSSILSSENASFQEKINTSKEFKDIKSIDISGFIIDPAKGLKLEIQTLLNSNYIMVYQNKQKVIKYLIFNDNLEVKSRNEIEKMDCYLQSIKLKVNGQKIVSYYVCRDKTYLQVFNTKLIRLHQKTNIKMIHSISLTQTNIYCMTSDGLDMFDWSLEFIKSINFNNTKKSLLYSNLMINTELKNEIFYVLCKGNVLNRLIIFNILTGVVLKTIEIRGHGMKIDLKNNIFVLSNEKLIHLNDNGILINETECKGLPAFSNVLFISSKKDKVLLYDSGTFSIKQCK